MKKACKNSKALADGLDADEYAEKVAKKLEYLVNVRNCRKIRYYGRRRIAIRREERGQVEQRREVDMVRQRTKRVVAMFLLAAAACCHAAAQYEDRWFYVARNLTKQEHVQEISNVVETAKNADLNGMLFSCGVERWNTWPAARKARPDDIVDDHRRIKTFFLRTSAFFAI